MKLVPIASAHSAFGASSCTAAPRRRSTSASTDTAVRDTLRISASTLDGAGEARGRVQAQHVGVAAGGRRVEVGRAPHAAVDVLAAADRHRREQPRHRARGLHRVGDARARRAGAPEHDPAAGPAVDGGDPQAAVEAGLEALEVPSQVAQRLLGPRQPAQEHGPRHRAAGGGQAERQRRERRADGERPLAGAARGGERRRRPARPRAAVRSAARSRSEPIVDGRRGGWPETRCAATIEPAEVPTK